MKTRASSHATLTSGKVGYLDVMMPMVSDPIKVWSDISIMVAVELKILAQRHPYGHK